MTEPVAIRLPCPECHKLHIDEGEFATKPHHTHACQFCGNVWRPAIVHTVGVKFLPGFKNPKTSTMLCEVHGRCALMQCRLMGCRDKLPGIT